MRREESYGRPGRKATRRSDLRRLSSGGEDGTRTRNPRLAKAVRYQLRHFPWWTTSPTKDESVRATKLPEGLQENTRPQPWPRPSPARPGPPGQAATARRRVGPWRAQQVHYPLPDRPAAYRPLRGCDMPGGSASGIVHVVGGLGPQRALGALLPHRLAHGHDRGGCRRDDDPQPLAHGIPPALGPTVVGLTGLEPVASSLSGKRSNRLSYRPAPSIAAETAATRQITPQRTSRSKRLGYAVPARLEWPVGVGQSSVRVSWTPPTSDAQTL